VALDPQPRLVDAARTHRIDACMYELSFPYPAGGDRRAVRGALAGRVQRPDVACNLVAVTAGTVGRIARARRGFAAPAAMSDGPR
jgi:hypothetical protein